MTASYRYSCCSWSAISPCRRNPITCSWSAIPTCGRNPVTEAHLTAFAIGGTRVGIERSIPPFDCFSPRGSRSLLRPPIASFTIELQPTSSSSHEMQALVWFSPNRISSAIGPNPLLVSRFRRLASPSRSDATLNVQQPRRKKMVLRVSQQGAFTRLHDIAPHRVLFLAFPKKILQIVEHIRIPFE